MSATLEEARVLLAEALGLSAGEVGNDSTVHTLKSWDSLGHMRIVAAIETRIGLTLEPEQILSLSSVQDVAALL